MTISKEGTMREPWRLHRRTRAIVRILLSPVLIVAVTLGWIAHQARVQRDIVATIERAGGTAIYDFQRRYDAQKQSLYSEAMGQESRLRQWLCKTLGRDYVGCVVKVEFPTIVIRANSVDLMIYKEDQELVRQIGKLTRLEVLDLSGFQPLWYVHPGITPQPRIVTNPSRMGREIPGPGLVHLSGLRRLKTLRLGFSDLSDGELAHLSTLTSLEHLSMGGGPQLNDASLIHLDGLKNLRSLQIQVGKFTGRAWSHLRQWPQLESVWLGGLFTSTFQPKDFKMLGELQTFNVALPKLQELSFPHLRAKLDYLDLSKSGVTDANMTLIAKLPALKTLNLTDTAITDEGMSKLSHRKGKMSVDLSGTRVSPAVAEEWNSSKP